MYSCSYYASLKKISGRTEKFKMSYVMRYNMREQLLLLIRISKPEYNKSLYDEYKLYTNPQMLFNKSGLIDGQYDKFVRGYIVDT